MKLTIAVPVKICTEMMGLLCVFYVMHPVLSAGVERVQTIAYSVIAQIDFEYFHKILLLLIMLEVLVCALINIMI